MKKVILVAAVSMMALASCKKDYTCTYDILGTETVIDYNDLNKEAKEAAESACTLVGGKFASK